MADVKGDTDVISDILADDDRRNGVIYAKFDPLTGENSVGERRRVEISDFVLPVQWLPVDMLCVPFVAKLVSAGSIDMFLEKVLHTKPNDIDRHKVSETFIRLRYRYDFPFWAASTVWIHNKDAGNDVLFRLRYPQRLLVAPLANLRVVAR